MTEGIVILSSGDERKDWLFDAIASIHRHCPDLGIHILSDAPVDVPFSWISRKTGFDSRLYKTRIFEFSPFDVTLMLDDDTVIHRHPGSLDKLLGRHDAALVPDRTRPTLGDVLANPAHRGRDWEEAQYTAKVCGTDATYFNGGVLLFRKSELAEKLFAKWHKEWQRARRSDQLALCRAIAKVRPVLKRLPDEYNSRPQFPEHPRNPFIFHFTGGRSKYSHEYHARHVGEHAKPHEVYTSFRNATRNGAYRHSTYTAIGKAIHALVPINLFVLACEADSALWYLLNRSGHTTRIAGDALPPVRVNSRDPAAPRALPPEYALLAGHAWDLVLTSCPSEDGRQDRFPYERRTLFRLTAASPSKPSVIAIDCDPLCDYFCHKLLGKPDLLIDEGDHADRSIAEFWLRNRLALSMLTR
jgi:hypothetical protein